MRSHLLDTDYYKFTQGQFILHNYPKVITEHVLINRNSEDNLLPIKKEIENALDLLCNVRLGDDDILFLKDQGIFKESYLDFLKILKLNRDHVIIEEAEDLKITVQGPFYLTIYFEKILSLISDIYNRHKYGENVGDRLIQSYTRLYDKMHIARTTPGFKFADFGTRRRFSYNWHQDIISTLKYELASFVFIGTSNVLLAKEFDLTPIGTQAHELFMMAQQIVDLKYSQKYILTEWLAEYDDALGIALTDTINSKSFLYNAFDKNLAFLYDGVRHDSGDPLVFADMVIGRYEELGINPREKTIVFSDGLDFERAQGILNYVDNKIKVSFGIGTNLTNDVPDVCPLSIVMKMQRCNGKPVAKISDEPGKMYCIDSTYLDHIKQTFNL